MAVMAYSPFDEGRLLRHPDLVRIAREAQVSTATLALAWLVSHDDVIAIPKAARVEHVDDIVAEAFGLEPFFSHVAPGAAAFDVQLDRCIHFFFSSAGAGAGAGATFASSV